MKKSSIVLIGIIAIAIAMILVIYTEWSRSDRINGCCKNSLQ